MLSVEGALARILDGARPSASETVPLAEAAGRVLAEPVVALRTQPPFAASAMDGYAVRAADVADTPVTLRLIGAAIAGKRFDGRVGERETARIFTGAPLPEGADAIVIQENATARGDGTVEIREPSAAGRHIRRRGLDFAEGDVLLPAGRLLDAAALSLAAAANHPRLTVVARPLVAIIATGDELLPPGSDPGPDQIIASNSYGVAAIAAAAGASILDLGIVPDDRALIAAAVSGALRQGADVIVTLGGASVGDHDLVREVLAGVGVEFDFWKIAMRPGKPLMFGRSGTTRCLGLPGNPVSSIVCAHLFVAPLVAALAGRPAAVALADATLGVDMPANDGRQDYVRATAEGSAGMLVVTPVSTQDSSMLRQLADSHVLIVRPPNAPPAKAGDACKVMALR